MSAFEQVRTRVRAQDPISSVMAAERAGRFAQTHADRILAALSEAGPSTAGELQALTALTVVQIDRRMSEMARGGLIRVVQHEGQDLMRGAYRVWEAV